MNKEQEFYGLMNTHADHVNSKAGTTGQKTVSELTDTVDGIPTGAKPDYCIAEGDSVTAMYFNTAYDLDDFLGDLTYPDTDPTTQCGVCNLVGYVFAVDLTNLGLTGEYAVVWNDGTNIVPLYSTTAVPAFGVSAAGWQMTSYTASFTASTIHSDFAEIIDDVVAKSEIAFGSGGGGSQPQLNAPTISISQMILTITNPSTNGNFVTGYKVYADGSLVASPTSTTVDLSSVVQGNSASITVKACGTNFEDSAASTAATFYRYFSVNMYDDDETTLLQTQSVQYGGMPSYTPTKTGYVFAGWKDSNNNTVTAIYGNCDIFAVWSQSATITKGTYYFLAPGLTAASYMELVPSKMEQAISATIQYKSSSVTITKIIFNPWNGTDSYVYISKTNATGTTSPTALVTINTTTGVWQSTSSMVSMTLTKGASVSAAFYNAFNTYFSKTAPSN